MGRQWLFVLVCAAAFVAYARSFTVPFQFDDIDQIVENPARRSDAGGAARPRPHASPSLRDVCPQRPARRRESVRLSRRQLRHPRAQRVPRLSSCRRPLPHAAPRRHSARCRRTDGCRRRGVPLRLPSDPDPGGDLHRPAHHLARRHVLHRRCSRVRDRAQPSGGRYGRPGHAYATALLLALAAYLSKENPATLPLAILLAEWTFYRGQSTRRSIVRWIPFVLLLGSAALLWLLYWRASARRCSRRQVELARATAARRIACCGHLSAAVLPHPVRGHPALPAPRIFSLGLQRRP